MKQYSQLFHQFTNALQWQSLLRWPQLVPDRWMLPLNTQLQCTTAMLPLNNCYNAMLPLNSVHTMRCQCYNATMLPLNSTAQCTILNCPVQFQTMLPLNTLCSTMLCYHQTPCTLYCSYTVYTVQGV